MKLDDSGLKLLEFLVALLPNVTPGDPRTYISYKGIHDRLGLSLEGSTYGESLKIQGLNSLANWTHSSNKPGITGLIVDQKTLLPGDGYFRLFNGGNEDFQWWTSQIVRAKNFDWLPYFQENSATSSINEGEWSSEELRASVEAYLQMLNFQKLGEVFVKTKHYNDLSKKFNRSAKSFEWRMQNISYVLSLMGREWLQGLRPARNVGARIAAEIENLIFEIEGRQGVPVSSDQILILEKIGSSNLPAPDGVLVPALVTSLVTQYKRSVEVKAWVLKQAAGICECCQNPAPFSRADGFAYLEVHHIRKLADGGSDTIENAVAVCPNCHRELHYGLDSQGLIEKLCQRLLRLKRK